MSHIYVYTKQSLMTHQDERWNSSVKVGYTDREPEKRVKEQDGTAEPEELVLLASFEIPKHLGEFDLVVHRILEQWGYKRTRTDVQREWFVIPANNITERLAIIHEAIQLGSKDSKAGCVELFLTPPQYEILEQTITSFNAGNSVIIEELCPRFGKTAWAIALLVSTSNQVLIVATYWLSALSSFRNDVAKFVEFENVRYVDTNDPNYNKQLQQHLDNGFKVVVGVSLCGGENRRDIKQTELKPLVDITNKIVFVDEADFGAWQPKQRELVDYLTSSDSKLILATGTNGARAATGRDIDDYFNVTYFDMLVAKSSDVSYVPRLNLPFKMSKDMRGIPDVEFYQMNFSGVVDGTIIGKDNLPLWSKASEDPHKAKGFIRSVFGALFNGDGEYEYMAFENVFGKKPTGIMIWLNEGCRKENIDKMTKLLESFVSDWKFYALHGDVTDGRNAEDEVKKLHAQAIREGKNGVVVVSSKMGARSFSVPEIDTIILAYDKGSAAQTAQKMSRGLTRGAEGKVCRVLSLSLDPTREDKLDAPILETAQKVADKQNVDINEAVRIVLRTLNVFTIDNVTGSRVDIDKDTYTSKVLSLASLSKIVTTTADIMTIIQNEDMVEKILKITATKNVLGKAEKIVATGKKFLDGKGRVKRDAKCNNEDEKNIKSLIIKIEDAIKALVDNSTIIAGMTPHVDIKSALGYLSSNPVFARDFQQEFGVEPSFVLMLCNENILSVHLIDLMLSVERKQTQAMINDFWS